MDILNFHMKLLGNYKSYIQSFLTIKDPKILEFVDAEIENKKLWPEPLVQFNPTFERGKPISDLVHSENLHPLWCPLPPLKWDEDRRAVLNAKEKEIPLYGEYRTRRLVLEA